MLDLLFSMSGFLIVSAGFFILAIGMILTSKPVNDAKVASEQLEAAQDALKGIKEKNRTLSPLTSGPGYIEENDFEPEAAPIARELEGEEKEKIAVGQSNADELETQMEALRKSIRDSTEKLKA